MSKNHYTKLLESLARKNLVSGKQAFPLPDTFVGVPQAGIFTQKDLDDVELFLVRSKARQAAYENQEVVEVKGIRETIKNTTRYRQVPGTSRIFGGRNE